MLEIKQLSVVYQSEYEKIHSVDQADLFVADGEKHFIIGESGSGKSVLLTAILGMSGGIVEGEILYKGVNLAALSEKEMRAYLGTEITYIPQGSGHGMNPLLKNGYQVAESLIVHRKMQRKAAYQKAVTAMEAMDIEDAAYWVKKYPGHLSGGMRQRMLLAMGMLSSQSLILADEPTKGLDNERRMLVETVFEKLSDRAVLCVSHDLEFVSHMAERVSVMYAGHIVESCRCDELFENPLHPYSKMLIASTPRKGFMFTGGFAPSHTEYKNFGCRFYARCPKRDDKCMRQPPVFTVGDRKVRCFHC